MQETIKKNMLLYGVQHAMFCPTCKKIMDVHKAVQFDLSKDGNLEYSKTTCAVCYDGFKDKLAAAAAAKGLVVEVIDGRDYAPKKKQKVAR